MTHVEYTHYQTRVEKFFREEGISSLSGGDREDEFSVRPCECCRRHWHGERFAATAWRPAEKKILAYSICNDCLYYVTYGQLDDMTMADMTD